MHSVPRVPGEFKAELARELYKAIRIVLERSHVYVPRALVAATLATVAAEQIALVALDQNPSPAPTPKRS